MFERILVPTDGSPLSENAIHAAVQFAKENGSEIIAMSVAQPYMYPALADGLFVDPTDPEAYNHEMDELACRRVDHIATLAKANEVPCETIIARSYSPSDEIVDAVNRYHCDVIFMATHGRSWFKNLFVESQTQNVLTHSSIPVVVFH